MNSLLFKKERELKNIIENVNSESLVSAIDSDKSVEPLKRIYFRRIFEGYLSGKEKYQKISESNLDYFLEVLRPVHEQLHVENYVNSPDEFKVVVENVGGKVNPDDVNEGMIKEFNRQYKSFKQEYPHFDFNQIETFGIYEHAYSRFVNMLHEVYNKKSVQEEEFTFRGYKNNILEAVSVKDITNKVRDVFDKQTIQLAWAVLFGKLKEYDETMKRDIENYAKQNLNDPKVEQIFGRGSFLEESKKAKGRELEFIDEVNEKVDGKRYFIDQLNKATEYIIGESQDHSMIMEMDEIFEKELEDSEEENWGDVSMDKAKSLVTGIRKLLKNSGHGDTAPINV